MRLNINKDLLMKNRFWVILAVGAGVILTGLIWLQLSDYAEAANVKNLAMVKKGRGNKGPYENTLSIAATDALAQTAGKAETIVWSEAWAAQESLYKWSKRVEEEFEFYDGLYATAITVSKLTDPKDWIDNERIMHGELIEADPNWLMLRNKDKQKKKFYRTKSADNVTLADGSKTTEFSKLFTFVNKMMVIVTYQKGRYFGEYLTKEQHQTFAENYKSQIHQILAIVDPLDENDKGVVQLRNWRYRPTELPDDKVSFIRFVNEPWDARKEFSKEAWAAQENLWIQKEIYRLIRVANDAVSKFNGTGGDGKNKTFAFSNASFELSLSLKEDFSLSLAIKNRLPKKQKLDLNFRVLMDKRSGFQPEAIRISAPALAANGDPGGKDLYVHTEPSAKGVSRTGVYSVDQVLTWESAAVKRIDHISIGSNDPTDLSHSQRTFPEPLLPHEAPAPKTGPIVEPGAGDPPGVVFRKGPGMVGVGGNANPFESGHGLWKDRYIEVSEQSRRVPVGIVLIVDQSQVDRILTVFNNSNLRFLGTQVLLNQYSGSLQPPALAEKQDPGVNPFPFPGGVVRPGVGVMPPPGQPAAAGSGAEGNMELVIYGIMTLYERYPPRPQTDKK